MRFLDKINQAERLYRKTVQRQREEEKRRAKNAELVVTMQLLSALIVGCVTLCLVYFLG